MKKKWLVISHVKLSILLKYFSTVMWIWLLDFFLSKMFYAMKLFKWNQFSKMYLLCTYTLQLKNTADCYILQLAYCLVKAKGIKKGFGKFGPFQSDFDKVWPSKKDIFIFTAAVRFPSWSPTWTHISDAQLPGVLQIIPNFGKLSIQDVTGPEHKYQIKIQEHLHQMVA